MTRSSYAPIIAAIVASAASVGACGGSTQDAATDTRADAAPSDAALLDSGSGDAMGLRDAGLRPGFTYTDCAALNRGVASLTAKPPHHYQELREQKRDPPHATDKVLQKTGTICAKATDAAACKSKLAAIDSPVKVTCSVPYPCTVRYLAYTRGDEVAFVLQENVAKLAAPIDSFDEALFTFSMGRSFGCEGSSYKASGDGYDFAYRYSFDDCPSTTRVHVHDVLAHQASDGVVTVIEDVETILPAPNTNTGCAAARGASDLFDEASAPINDAGDWFATAARLEAASVGSFVRLARELVAHGAPASLVCRAAEAARDERRHARLLRSLARAAGKLVTPAPRVARVVRSLEAIASENAVEGAARETWAAVMLSYQARSAESENARGAFESIAHDEIAHAELAADVGAWLATRLGAVSARVEARRRATIAAIEREIANAYPEPVRRALGLPSPAVAKHLFAGARAHLFAA